MPNDINTKVDDRTPNYAGKYLEEPHVPHVPHVPHPVIAKQITQYNYLLASRASELKDAKKHIEYLTQEIQKYEHIIAAYLHADKLLSAALKQ